jgi:hypothetical protein
MHNFGYCNELKRHTRAEFERKMAEKGDRLVLGVAIPIMLALIAVQLFGG